jgi:hypothetical protein
MTFPELSPSSFHDAHQGLSPKNQSRTTPASAMGATPANENTPIGQRCLLTQPGRLESDDVEDVNDEHNKNLRRIYNQSVELDMDLVEEDANEEGDGDSNCSAAEADKLFFSMLESASDRRDIVVLEDDHDILCDTPHNMIKIKRELAPKVKVSKPPADWAPDRIKVECAEPESFLKLTTPANGDSTLSAPNSTRKRKEKTSKKGNIHIMRYQLGQDQFQLMPTGKGRRLGGNFTSRGGQTTMIQATEVAPRMRIPSLSPKRVILIMNC